MKEEKETFAFLSGAYIRYSMDVRFPTRSLVHRYGDTTTASIHLPCSDSVVHIGFSSRHV